MRSVGPSRNPPSRLRADGLRLFSQISRRAQLGWSTAGHSGVDVNFYAYGFVGSAGDYRRTSHADSDPIPPRRHNSTGLIGNVENTDVGTHIATNMGLNLDGGFDSALRPLPRKRTR